MPLLRSRLLPKLPWKCLYFDGEDDYVKVPAGFLPTNAITVEALVMGIKILPTWTKWLNTGPDTTEGIFGYGFDLGGDRIGLVAKADDGTILASTGDIRNVVGKWIHIAITWNGSVGKGFVNGSVVKTIEASGTPGWIDRPLIIGANIFGTENFCGYIAMIRIYSRALTEDEVRWNYYHPDDPIRSGLVLWLHYDSIDEVSGIWKDKSPYGNDGTIYGATAVEFTKPPIRRLSPTRILSPVR